MISVEEANQLIAVQTKDFGTEAVALQNSTGRVLRETIKADRDFPPFDRVTMDGIAIRYVDYESGTRDFKISGVAAAGAEKMNLEVPNECLEVMTGAIMPDGLDTVIRYEDLEIKDGVAHVQAEVRHQQNIHFKGLDRKEGSVILEPGKKIDSPEIGVLATVGKAMVEVSRLPKALIISSGDELVEVDEQPEAHQIRKSNIHQLQTILNQNQIEADTAHLVDEYDVIVEKLKGYLEEYDLLVLSGGVSKGKFDYLPEALEAVGVKKHFHRIAQRPGKPFWFGTSESSIIFAFPGNPVSSFMCAQQYLIPWLDQCTQVNPQPRPMAVLAEEVTFKPDLTYFLDVQLSHSDDGRLIATPVKGNGSGDLAKMVDGDGFIVLPAGKEVYKEGEVYSVIRYR